MAGSPPPRHAPPDVERDLYLVARSDPAAIVDEVVSLASRRLPEHLGLDARADVQVLAPMHKGRVGVDALNTELRAVLNPDGEPLPSSPLRSGWRWGGSMGGGGIRVWRGWSAARSACRARKSVTLERLSTTTVLKRSSVARTARPARQLRRRERRAGPFPLSDSDPAA